MLPLHHLCKGPARGVQVASPLEKLSIAGLQTDVFSFGDLESWWRCGELNPNPATVRLLVSEQVMPIHPHERG